MRLEKKGIDTEMSAEISSTGSTVTRLQYQGDHLFFPQQVVSIEGKLKLRGGNPICCPFFGDGFEGAPRHGWLRDEKTMLVRESYEVNTMTIDTFFVLSHEGYQLDHSLWRIDCLVDHRISSSTFKTRLRLFRGDDSNDFPAPVNPAFHPYFPFYEDCVIDIGYEHSNKEIHFREINEFSPIILPAPRDLTWIKLEGIGRVYMSLGDDFKNSDYEPVVVIWTDNKRKYICIEPVLSNPDKFNTEKGIFLDKGKMVTISCEFGLYLE